MRILKHSSLILFALSVFVWLGVEDAFNLDLGITDLTHFYKMCFRMCYRYNRQNTA